MKRPKLVYASTSVQRFLLFGEEGSGKTTALLRTAQSMWETEAKPTCYLLSPQAGEQALMQKLGGAGAFANVVVLPMVTYADLVLWFSGTEDMGAAQRKLITKGLDVSWPGLESVVASGDWVMLDMGGDLEAMLRDYYCQTNFGKPYAEMVAFTTSKSKTGTRAKILQTFEDIDPDAYQKMSQMFDGRMRWLFAHPGLNVMITTPTSPVLPQYVVPKAYMDLGFTPKINKGIRVDVDSIIYMSRVADPRTGKYTYKFQAVQKDRNAPPGTLPSGEVTDAGFWVDYCAAVGLDAGIAPGV